MCRLVLFSIIKLFSIIFIPTTITCYQNILNPNQIPSSLIIQPTYPTSKLETISNENTNRHFNSTKRERRSVSSKKLTIELVAITDKTMTNYHKENLETYVQTLVQIASGVFSDPSIGQSIDIELVHIISLDYEFNVTTYNVTGIDNTTRRAVDASELLLEFLKWQQNQNETENWNYDYDTALLLTRLDLCDNQGSCSKAGMAEVASICVKARSGFIVEDNGLVAGFSIAHELGHLLSMDHDDEENCQSIQTTMAGDENKGSSKSNEFRIMSSTNEINWNPWEWSECSKKYLAKFLSDGGGHCLEQKNSLNLTQKNLFNDHNLTQNIPPGQRYGMIDQCKLFTGQSNSNSTFTVDLSIFALVCPPIDCRSLVCPEEMETGLRCVVWNKLAADGTSCGDEPTQMWCQRGDCVMKFGDSGKPTKIKINGGWGNWSEFGECTRTCGGGIQKSERECNNPTPQNGGEFCLGDRIRYVSCNTMECPNETNDSEFKKMQCEKFNGNNLNLPNIPENVTWMPVPNRILQHFSMNDRCKLFCMNRHDPKYLYRLDNRNLIDGTRCDDADPINFNVCVNGKCLPGGCDRVLYSDKTIDNCGVCDGGNKTCQQILKWINGSTVHNPDPQMLFRIPAGAYQLEISQYSQPTRTNLSQSQIQSHNFLALFEPASQKYVFNDPINRKIYTNGGTAQGGSILINYSGYNFFNRNINLKERLKAVVEGQATKSELILQIFSNNPNEDVPYHVVYKYVINSQVKFNQTLQEEDESNWVKIISDFFNCLKW